MGSTSVKVTMPDKRRIDRLQARVTAQRGRKISQQELLARILDLAERHAGEIAPRRPSRKDLDWLLGLPRRSGRRTREEDIDKELYGAAP